MKFMLVSMVVLSVVALGAMADEIGVKYPVSDARVTKVFEMLDADKDGKISTDEVITFLKNDALHPDVHFTDDEAQAQLAIFLRDADISKDGFVTLDELKTYFNSDKFVVLGSITGLLPPDNLQ